MTETPTEICFIETGGTIAGTKNKGTKAIEVSTSSSFDDHWLKKLNKEVKFQQPIKLEPPLLSEEMNPSDWTRKHPSGANQMLATAKQGVVPIS